MARDDSTYTGDPQAGRPAPAPQSREDRGNMVRAGLAELVGTFFLVYTGTATASEAAIASDDDEQSDGRARERTHSSSRRTASGRRRRRSSVPIGMGPGFHRLSSNLGSTGVGGGGVGGVGGVA